MKTMMNNTRSDISEAIELSKDRIVKDKRVLDVNEPKETLLDATKDNKKLENQKNPLEKNDSVTLNAVLQNDGTKNDEKIELPQRKFAKLEDYKKCLKKQSKIEKKTDEIKESIEFGKVSKLVNKFEMIGKYDMPKENLLACTNNLKIDEENNLPTLSKSNTKKEEENTIKPQENNVINFSDELKVDVKEKINKINEISSLSQKIVEERIEKSLIKTRKNEEKEIIHEEKKNSKKENISFAAKIRNIFSVQDNESRSKLLEKMCIDRVENGSYFDLTKFNCEAEEFIPEKEESINDTPGIFSRIFSFFTCGKEL